MLVIVLCLANVPSAAQSVHVFCWQEGFLSRVTKTSERRNTVSAHKKRGWYTMEGMSTILKWSKHLAMCQASVRWFCFLSHRLSLSLSPSLILVALPICLSLSVSPLILSLPLSLYPSLSRCLSLPSLPPTVSLCLSLSLYLSVSLSLSLALSLSLSRSGPLFSG